MDASRFIAGRLRFGGRIAMVSIAVSFLIMIIAVSVSSGFRKELRNGVSDLAGDVQLMPVDMNYISEDGPVSSHPSFLPLVKAIPGVDSVANVVYRAGIVKKDGNIHGVLFKGVQTPPAVAAGADSVKLGISIPQRLSDLIGVQTGDKLLTYFVGENVKVRNFNIVSSYEGIMDGTDEIVIYADLADLQRLNGWDSDEVSMMEVALKPSSRDSYSMKRVSAEAGRILLDEMGDDDDTLVATSVTDRYSAIFDWLDLIDFNVLFILVLMTIVAGFNMISGLLIMLFRNISTIGTLKSMGMTDRMIGKVFLRVAASIVLKGMLWGNAVALVFCFVQDRTHLLKLSAENYFVSFVPVSVNLPSIVAADAVSFLVIMLLLLIPCLFIARIDPAQTVRAQ